MFSDNSADLIGMGGASLSDERSSGSDVVKQVLISTVVVEPLWTGVTKTPLSALRGLGIPVLSGLTIESVLSSLRALGKRGGLLGGVAALESGAESPR